MKLLLIAAAGVVLLLLVQRFSQRSETFDTAVPAVTAVTASEAPPSASSPGAAPQQAAAAADAIQPSETGNGNEDYKAVDYAPAAIPSECFPKDRLTAEDLLPKDAANSKWAQLNPAGQGDVKDKNFLTAGYHVGINTVGSSLRNANLQLRSETPNPRMDGLSPWMNSTIEADVLRRPLELGEA